MKIHTILFSLFASILSASIIFSPSWAEEENRMAKGALVGAGTNVIGGAVLDSLDGPTQPQYVQSYGPDGQPYWQQVNLGPQEDPNKTILKRAVQGAVTGAVAAEFSGGDNESSSNSIGSSQASPKPSKRKISDDDDDEDDDGDWKGKKSKSKGKKSKDWDKDRPPGWDKGKKVGWGDGDVPPGHQDDFDHPSVENESEEDSWWKKLFGGNK
jgi:hypothetical protein